MPKTLPKKLEKRLPPEIWDQIAGYVPVNIKPIYEQAPYIRGQGFGAPNRRRGSRDEIVVNLYTREEIPDFIFSNPETQKRRPKHLHYTKAKIVKHKSTSTGNDQIDLSQPWKYDHGNHLYTDIMSRRGMKTQKGGRKKKSASTQT